MKPVSVVIAMVVLCGTLLATGRHVIAETAAKPNPVTLAAQLASARSLAARYRAGVTHLVSFTADLTGRHQHDPDALLERQDRQQIRLSWQSLVDYYLAMDVLRSRLPMTADLSESQRAATLAISYDVFLTQYRHALAWISTIEKDERVVKLLDEPLPSAGIGDDSYSAFKFRYLNVARAAEFVAFQAASRIYYPYWPKTDTDRFKADAAFIWRMGRGKGPRMTFENGWDMVQKTGFDLWLPVQQGIADWMGDTKVWRPHRNLISIEMIHHIQQEMQPGDVMVQRREWHLSNIGIPGYWTHAALYIGTPEQRRRFFDDPAVRAWLEGKAGRKATFEQYFSAILPSASIAAAARLEHDRPARVLEAIGEGVVMTSFEHSAHADAMGVLRPRLPKVDIARALIRAFAYHGRPYDYNFDFDTDAALVCSELIYKMYEPGSNFTGLNLPLITVAGHKLCPPNDIVRQFDEQAAKAAAQFDFVLFLDGRERTGRAERKDQNAFRNTWRRPKWHIIAKEIGSN